MEVPPYNLQDLENLLPRACCQLPQHKFRGPVESTARWVRAVQMAKGELLNIRWGGGGHNVSVDRCICIIVQETLILLLKPRVLCFCHC